MWLIVLYILATVASINTETEIDVLKHYVMQGEEGRLKVVIDTDGGVDDAMAILMGLASFDLDILAITTTAGNTNTEQVIVNINKALRVARITVPIHPGAEKPFVPNPAIKDPFGFGRDAFGDVPYPYPPYSIVTEKEHAVSAIVRIVSENPNEVTIIALGPLTNIALAIRLNPEFKKSLKGIFWTGGNLFGFINTGTKAEFNAYFDPVAMHICFNEEGPPIIMIPWETTLKGSELFDWRQSVLGRVDTPQMNFFNVIEKRALSNGSWMARDVKTMAVVINYRAVRKLDYYYVEPIWEGAIRGHTLVDHLNSSGKNPNAIIIEDISTESFQSIVKYFLQREPTNIK